ncbi:MAG: vanadium-dependent haloperoxidase [Verrucomicrobiota bacterium]
MPSRPHRFINDGSRQTNGVPYPLANPPVAYPDYPASEGGYVYVNDPLPVGLEGILVRDINHWQRLQIVNAVDQNGFPQGPLQTYLGAQWLGVRPFALGRTDPAKPWIDPGPPPYFGGASHAQFLREIIATITADSQLNPDDEATLDISPRARGNNSLEFEGVYGNGELEIYDGHGYTNNPVTGQPYAPHLVKRGDYARVVAEFWADGPNSETPPGHWNTLVNYIADHPLTVKRIGGTGPVVDDLEWDVKAYFALNAAAHDAACAAWGTKRAYDGWRPLCAIRYLATLGQSSDPAQPFYHALGLPLITNLIELVTASSSAPGGRHAGLRPGKIAVRAWPGPPADLKRYAGVKWIHADAWSTYQRTNFVTPAFPGYFSGHSSFSRAAAEVLTALTGSPFFPGGLGSYTNYVLGFESGPSQPVTLQWATYFDAADEAGISRIWGGIHPPIDNLAGRRSVASQVGKEVWALAKKYFDGGVTDTPVEISRVGPGQYRVRYHTVRGVGYRLESSADLREAFRDDLPEVNRPFDALTVTMTNSTSAPMRFHRAVGTFVR